MAKRKQRRHGDNPAGWTWRDGRPRWIPSPTLRKAGWKGGDLKDDRGLWLARGASIDAALALNGQVQVWREGRPVEERFARFAPAGAAGGGRKAERDRFSIGVLIEAFAGTKDGTVKPSPEFADLRPSTQKDYRNKLKRLVDVLAGWVELPKKGDANALARYTAAVEETLADPIFILQPTEQPGGGMVDLLYDAYHQLLEHAGVNQASGVMVVARLWLNWCHKRQSRRIVNWAADVELRTPAGRLRRMTWEEIAAMVKAAEAKGYPSIADSVILGVDLSWSQTDRLKLSWDRVRDDRAFTGQAGRQKTGRVGGTPFLSIGRRRVATIRERQAQMAAQPTHVLWCEDTGAPWKADHYRHVYAEIRAEAAKEVPSVADTRDQDLRDTAVTVAYDAGLDEKEIASRTLQKLDTIKALLDRHYGEIGPEVADRGRDRLDAYLEAKGVGL